MLQNTNFSNGHEEYKTDSTCVSRKKAHSIRRIGEGIRCQIVVIVPYSYIFVLVSDVHIYVMVDGVGGDMVCDQNTLHGHPLSDKRYWYMMVSLKKNVRVYVMYFIPQAWPIQAYKCTWKVIVYKLF